MQDVLFDEQKLLNECITRLTSASSDISMSRIISYGPDFKEAREFSTVKLFERLPLFLKENENGTFSFNFSQVFDMIFIDPRSQSIKLVLKMDSIDRRKVKTSSYFYSKSGRHSYEGSFYPYYFVVNYSVSHLLYFSFKTELNDEGYGGVLFKGPFQDKYKKEFVNRGISYELVPNGSLTKGVR